MIACLHGELFFKSDEKIVVMAGGVGYEIFVTSACLSSLPEVGHPVLVHVHTHVREDALLLYGFVNEEEKQMFLLLLGVSGVGPKLALSVLSGITPNELANAIRREDLHRLTKLSGVGKKTAERLCLELKDKMQWIAEQPEDKAHSGAVISDDLARDATSALVNFGYPPVRAEDAVMKVLSAAKDPAAITLEELVKQALRRLV